MAVYLVQSGDDGPVKIGYAGNPRSRMIKMRADSAAPLRMIGLIPGDRSNEAQLHRKFSAFRHHGEWFAPAPGILSLAAQFPVDGDLPVSRKPKRGRPRRPATTDLARYLDREDLSCAAFATAVGLSRFDISRFASSDRLPTLENACEIERSTDGEVTPRSFVAAWRAKKEAA